MENTSTIIYEKKFHGSFPGHAIPGTFFFCFGIWWCVSALRKYFQSKLSADNKEFVSTATFACICCCSPRMKKAPVEAMIKIVCCATGMAIEAIGFWWGDVARMQHFTMYAFFGFSGVIDLMMEYKALRGLIPTSIGHVLLAISFLVEGLLFHFHLHGRPLVDVTLHYLLVYTCYITTAVILLESMYPKSLVLCLGRSLLSITQGTWFWQVGSIIYPIIGEKWDLSSHKCAAVVVVLFSWHILSGIVLMSICAIIVHRYCAMKIEGISSYKLEIQTSEIPINSEVKVNGFHSSEIKEDRVLLLNDSDGSEDI